MNYKIKQILCVCSVLVFGFWFLWGWTKGLSVSPASYHWHAAPVGIKTECPAGIMIMNSSDQSQIFKLKILTPREINLPLDKNFIDLPDKKWLSFSEDIIEIKAGGWIQVQMSAEIPAQYRNQQWDFFIEVKQIAKNKETFQIATYSRFKISTE